jgi:hypothetical protein
MGAGAPLPGLEWKVIFCFIKIPCQLVSPRDRKTAVLVRDISLHKDPVGERGAGLVYQGL